MDTFFMIFGWIMAAFLGGTIIYAIFWGGTSGAFFVLFLIGAGLLGGGKARRRTPSPSPFGEEEDGMSVSLHKRIYDPRYAAFPENNMHDIYMRDQHK